MAAAGVDERADDRVRLAALRQAVVQLALSLTLLIGALLMVSTLRNLRGIDLGFEPEGVTVATIELGQHGYDRRRALELVPDALVREVFVLGAPGAMRERLLAFAAAGVDSLCLLPLCTPDAAAAFVDALAPA